MTPPEEGDTGAVYDGKERRGTFMISLDLKTILAMITLITIVLPVIVFTLQVRQDLRSNTIQLIQMKATADALETRVATTERDYQRAKLLFCAARDDTDTIRARELPDIGC